jgi:hypothetical protein
MIDTKGEVSDVLLSTPWKIAQIAAAGINGRPSHRSFYQYISLLINPSLGMQMDLTL